MSVWKKFQRVGKQAAKFQFNASYSELKLETNGFQPEYIVISWVHRNRKYASKPIKLIPVPTSQNDFSYVWEIQDNVEIITTLYKVKKETIFEEKDWTFQLDDVKEDGTRRRVLAYRNINIAQYADRFPTQHSIKICFKLSSKKIKSATLFLTLSSVFLKEGDATDDDMISVASLMSIPSNPQIGNSISIPNSDIARLSDLDDLNGVQNYGDNGLEVKSDVKGQITELCDQIGQFDMNESIIEEEEDEDFSSKFVDEENNFKQTDSSSTPDANKTAKSPHNSNDIRNDENNKSESQPPELQSEYRNSEDAIASSNDSTLDLLNWSQELTKSYPSITINNYTTSFRNGIAFCAIIHHYKPDLIATDIESLNPSHVKENNKLAFNAASTLGIPKVLDPNEMAILKVPDPLSVMTYLHQLRTHFTGEDIVCTPASLGANQSPGRVTSGHSSPSSYQKMYAGHQDNTQFPELSGTSNQTNFPNSQVNVSKSNNESHQKENHVNNTDRMNPFLEPEEIAEKQPVSPSTKEKSLKKISPKKQKLKLASFNMDGTIKEEKSLSEKKVKKINLGKLSMLSTDHPTESNKESGSSSNGRVSAPNPQPSSPQTTHTSENISTPVNAPVVTPQQSHNLYLSAEYSALEKEQEIIDEQANLLERQLRAAMKGKDGEKQKVLLAKWFDLVNKKNALIRRNMQLQILEKEQNLEKKWSLLQNELRQIISVEEYSKTDEMRRREELLMKDLIVIINQRDNVVNELDKYEQGLAAEIEFARQNPEVMNANSRSLANANFKDKNCIVM